MFGRAASRGRVRANGTLRAKTGLPVRHAARLGGGPDRRRIVHCSTDADVAFHRVRQRARDNPLRRAHADPGPEDPDRPAFIRIALDTPSLEVDTTDGYRPGFGQIVAFVNDPAPEYGG